jgi:hypothetical protein
LLAITAMTITHEHRIGSTFVSHCAAHAAAFSRSHG